MNKTEIKAANTHYANILADRIAKHNKGIKDAQDAHAAIRMSNLDRSIRETAEQALRTQEQAHRNSIAAARDEQARLTAQA